MAVVEEQVVTGLLQAVEEEACVERFRGELDQAEAEALAFLGSQ